MKEGRAGGWRGGWQEQALAQSLGHSRARSALPTSGHRVSLPGSPCSRVMQGLEITLTWLCREQPLQSWLLLSHHLLLPWPKHITHLFVRTGDTAAPLGCHIPAIPSLHPEHLPPRSRALCSKVTGCSLVRFRVQPGQLLGLQPSGHAKVPP